MSKVMDLFFKIDVAMNNGFEGRISKFAQSIGRAQEALTRLNTRSGQVSSYEKVQSSIMQTSDALAKAKYRYNSMTPSVQAAQAKCSELAMSLGRERGILRQTGMLHGTNSKEYQAQAKVVRELEKAHKDAVKSFQKFSDEQGKAGDKVKSLEEKLSGQRQQAAELGRALESAGVNTRNLAGEQSKLQAQMERVASLKNKFESLKQSLSWGNIKADLMSSAALLTPFQKPIKLAADFESAMARVKAAGFVREGSDLKQFEALRKQALKLGDTTRYTSLDAAATQEVLIRGGVKVPDVLKAMPTVMAMATSEEMPLNRSAEILVSLSSAMNLSMDNVTHLADVLAIMSASYKTSIDSLYESIAGAAGVANLLKMPVEHLAALGAVAQQMGVEASVVKTSLKTGLLRLSKPTKEVKDAMSTLGLKMSDIADDKGHFRDINELLTQMHTQMQKLGPQKRAAVAGGLFGKYGVDTWTKLINAAGQGMIGEAIEINNTEADGTVKKMQDIIMETYNGNKALYESSIAGLQTWIGDKLKPINEYIMNKATSAVSKVTEFAKANDTTAGTATQAAYVGVGAYTGYKAIGYASKGIQLAKTWLELKTATTAVTAGAEAVSSTTGALSAVSTAAAETGASMTAIGTGAQGAASTVSSSAGSMLSSLGAVSAAVLAIWHNWERFKAEGIHMNDNLIQQKMTHGSNRDRTLSTGSGGSIFGGRKRALGGMITRPEIALIGEAGPEVVIPLSPGKKSRGMQLLNTAANSLGVNIMNPVMQDMNTQGISTSSIFDSSQDLRGSSYNTLSENNNQVNRSMNPVINITVNANNSKLDNDGANNLAQDIYSRVRDALSELMNNEDRLSYA